MEPGRIEAWLLPPRREGQIRASPGSWSRAALKRAAQALLRDRDLGLSRLMEPGRIEAPAGHLRTGLGEASPGSWSRAALKPRRPCASSRRPRASPGSWSRAALKQEAVARAAPPAPGLSRLMEPGRIEARPSAPAGPGRAGLSRLMEPGRIEAGACGGPPRGRGAGLSRLMEPGRIEAGMGRLAGVAPATPLPAHGAGPH